MATSIPRCGETGIEYGYRQRKVLYRNLGNGRFADVSMDAGPGILEKAPGRGCAFGDFDNDGDVDVRRELRQRCSATAALRFDAEEQLDQDQDASARNRTAAASARASTALPGQHQQMDEVRSGGSYLSQNDLRVHFGLGGADKADIEIRWPSGIVDQAARAVRQISVYTVVEGKGIRT